MENYNPQFLIPPWWEYLYYNQNKIKVNKITISNGITSIGDYSFYYTTAEENYQTGEMYNIQTCFEKVTSISIPSSVKRIGMSTFEGCKNLSAISIPKGATEIGANAFAYTPWLKNRKAGNSIVVINNALVDYKITPYETFTVPNTVKYIGEGVLREAAFFAPSIMIPASVISINDNAIIISPSEIAHVTVKGKSGSAAQKYAKKHGFEFIAV